MKTSVLSLIIASLLLLVCAAGSPPTIQLYQFNYEHILGTSLELKVSAFSEHNATQAEAVALEEIDRLNGILSTYDPTSELSRWQQTLNIDVKLSPELFDVLTLFDHWRVKTGGALNASAGIALNLWKKAAIDQTLPTLEELALATILMNQKHWELNTVNQTAKHLSTDPLVLNSFVKSYILQKVAEQVMNVPGVTGTVINMGGDIVVTGNQNEPIRIADPKADAENDTPLSILSLRNKAIATSGNYRRGFQIGEQWFSHILDARTAIPAEDIISATVVAEDPAVAGALATAFNILSPKESEELAQQMPGVQFMIITKTGQQIKSNGWKEMEIRARKEITDRSTTFNKQNDFELTIEIELARFEGRIRRPFVAVWIEDKNKEPIRNLAVWYNKSRWLPDLKRWYSKNQLVNQPESLSSISSATRSPGKYTFTWDGLDDHGKPVSSGKYTIYIEAAREHGTYQLLKQEVDWNGKSKHVDISGGVEITAASIDIHKVATTK